MVLENSSPREIAKYLFLLETKSMGMNGNLEHCLKVADLVLNAREEIWRYRNEPWQKQT